MNYWKKQKKIDKITTAGVLCDADTKVLKRLEERYQSLMESFRFQKKIEKLRGEN